jgi:hypothetical protein
VLVLSWVVFSSLAREPIYGSFNGRAKIESSSRTTVVTAVTNESLTEQQWQRQWQQLLSAEREGKKENVSDVNV